MLTRITFGFENATDFLALVFGVLLVDNIAKWCEIIIYLVFAVHSVVYRYEAYIHLRQHYFGIIADHYVISAETRHIFDNDCSDKPVIYVIH